MKATVRKRERQRKRHAVRTKHEQLSKQIAGSRGLIGDLATKRLSPLAEALLQQRT
jgi:hypothetical protein